MAVQPTITEFFKSRKRLSTCEDIKKTSQQPAKVIVLDEAVLQSEEVPDSLTKRIVYSRTPLSKTCPKNTPARVYSGGKIKTGVRNSSVKKQLFKKITSNVENTINSKQYGFTKENEKEEMLFHYDKNTPLKAEKTVTFDSCEPPIQTNNDSLASSQPIQEALGGDSSGTSCPPVQLDSDFLASGQTPSPLNCDFSVSTETQVKVTDSLAYNQIPVQVNSDSLDSSKTPVQAYGDPVVSYKSIQENSNSIVSSQPLINNNIKEAASKFSQLPKADPKSFPPTLNTACSSTTRFAKLSGIQKDLKLGELQTRLSRHSRVGEIKAALARINSGHSRIENLQHPTSPQLHKFRSIDVEVPTSPAKSPMKDALSTQRPTHSSGKLRTALFRSPQRESPVKRREAAFASPHNLQSQLEPAQTRPYISPRKLFDSPPLPTTKTPAYQRYAALVADGQCALTLPYKYRTLAETFRCVDTVAAMLHNRRETVSLAKMRPAVQEMSRKNLTEVQLAQINSIYPSAFSFSQEKLRTYSPKTDSNKHDLVLTPNLPAKSGSAEPQAVLGSVGGGTEGEDVVHRCELVAMTPTLLLQRRRAFYKALIERTKTYHAEFLSKLEPPLVVPRDSLMRWHPEFDVDGVPDIIPSPLPQPPNSDKCTTAKEVLAERARGMFTAMPRMERALERISGTAPHTPSPHTAATAIPGLTNALRGLPQALIEKVRAKQAARALEAMLRSPAQTRADVQLSRLPEMARILRNVFVAEKKNVLPVEFVLQKLDNSYREGLTNSELEEHLALLAEKSGGWLELCSLRKVQYVRVRKGADMAAMIAGLEALAHD